jgi:hypothetical protein
MALMKGRHGGASALIKKAVRRTAPKKVIKQMHEKSVKGPHSAPGAKKARRMREFLEDDTERFAAFNAEYLGLPMPNLPALTEAPADPFPEIGLSSEEYDTLADSLLHGDKPKLSAGVIERVKELQGKPYLQLGAGGQKTLLDAPNLGGLPPSHPLAALFPATTLSAPNNLPDELALTASQTKQRIFAEKAITETLSKILTTTDPLALSNHRYRVDNQLSQILKVLPPTSITSNLGYITSLVPPAYLDNSPTLLPSILGPRTVLSIFKSSTRLPESTTSFKLYDTMVSLLSELKANGRDYANLEEFKVTLIQGLPYAKVKAGDFDALLKIKDVYESLTGAELHGKSLAIKSSDRSNRVNVQAAAGMLHSLMNIVGGISNDADYKIKKDIMMYIDNVIDDVVLTVEGGLHTTEFYNARIRRASLEGKSELGVNLLREMKEDGVDRDVSSYSHALRGLQKSLFRDKNVLKSNMVKKPGPSGMIANHELLNYYVKILNDVVVQMEEEEDYSVWLCDDIFDQNELVRSLSNVFMEAGDTMSALAVWRGREVLARSVIEDVAGVESIPENDIMSLEIFNQETSVAKFDKRDYAELLSSIARAPQNQRTNELFVHHGRASGGLLSEDVLFYNSLTKVNWRPMIDTQSVDGLTGLEQGIAGMVWDEFDDDPRPNRGKLKLKKMKEIQEPLGGEVYGRSPQYDEEFENDEFWDVRGDRFAEVEAFNKEIGANKESYLSDEEWEELADAYSDDADLAVIKRLNPQDPEHLAYKEKLLLAAEDEENSKQQYLDADAVLALVRGSAASSGGGEQARIEATNVDMNSMIEGGKSASASESAATAFMAAATAPPTTTTAATTATTASTPVARFNAGSVLSVSPAAVRPKPYASGGGDMPMNVFGESRERVGDVPMVSLNDSRAFTQNEKVELQLAVMKEYHGGSLTRAPLTTLIKALRVTPEEHINHTALNNDRYALAKTLMDNAMSTNNCDIVVLNAALSSIATAGRLRTALDFYETKFAENGLEPDKVSAKIILEMLCKSKYIDQAEDFFQGLPKNLKSVDAYAHLVKFYGDRGKITASLELLRECYDDFGTVPSEKFVRQLRLHCRQQGLTNYQGVVLSDNVVKKFRLEFQQRREALGQAPLEIEGGEEGFRESGGTGGDEEDEEGGKFRRHGKVVEKYDFSVIVPSKSRRGLTSEERKIIHAIELIPKDPSAIVKFGMSRGGKRQPAQKKWNKQGWEMRNKGYGNMKSFVKVAHGRM